jgi:UPF0755 protein
MMTLMVVALFLMGGVILWGQRQYTAAGPLAEPICLQVPRGSNMARVSEDLGSRGAITSPSIFRMAADYTDKSHLLKAGSYLVKPGATMEDIVSTVTRGGASTCGTEIVYRIGVTRTQVQVRELDPATERFIVAAEFRPGSEAAPALYTDKRREADTRYRVAVAEGVTSWQIVDALRGMDVLQGDVPDIPAEGSLAPDSYEIAAGGARSDVLDRMAVAQRDRVAAVWDARQPNLPLASPEEMVVLASIIEKETGVPEERGQVSSVFVNRLRRGMRLQTDPTVIYGITQGQGVLGRGLRQSELRRATPWNTYVIEGLPPTPIANPGLASLQAAVDPDVTNFVFFVADGTGGHAFAETLEEHNQNVARWREIEAQRRDN